MFLIAECGVRYAEFGISLSITCFLEEGFTIHIGINMDSFSDEIHPKI